MADDDLAEIRRLIDRWIAGIHARDIDAVLADHAADIVMYDVPPPYRGVIGIDAYRESWPQFFVALDDGTSFDLESMDVTAGEDIAFAYGLLRCGTAAGFEREPEQRLRLTIGLRKDNNRWIVAHEHHSFTDASGPD